MNQLDYLHVRVILEAVGDEVLQRTFVECRIISGGSRFADLQYYSGVIDVLLNEMLARFARGEYEFETIKSERAHLRKAYSSFDNCSIGSLEILASNLKLVHERPARTSS